MQALTALVIRLASLEMAHYIQGLSSHAPKASGKIVRTVDFTGKGILA